MKARRAFFRVSFTVLESFLGPGLKIVEVYGDEGGEYRVARVVVEDPSFAEVEEGEKLPEVKPLFENGPPRFVEWARVVTEPQFVDELVRRTKASKGRETE